MRASTILPSLLALLTTTEAAIKTSIWIDQIPAYSALAPCAENRVSAVVRAQASGCGDDQQLTSFACFCVDQSSHMSSIISTAVQDYCAAGATTLTASLTAPLPEVTSALDVFNSYCARSTELVWYQQNSTAPTTLIITAAPSSPLPTTTTTSSTPSTQPSPSPHHSVPIAAIAAPVVLGILLILSIVCLLFFLRRRRAKRGVEPGSSAQKPGAWALPPAYAGRDGPRDDVQRDEMGYGEVHEVQSPPLEAVGDAVKYRYELETRPAELEGGGGKR